MDFDPAPVFDRVRVPTLLFYGESDEWSPIDRSVAVWRRAGRRSGNSRISIVRLPGTQHAPTLGDRRTARAISPDYHRALGDWLEAFAAGR
jgi:uncharacterized protein